MLELNITFADDQKKDELTHHARPFPNEDRILSQDPVFNAWRPGISPRASGPARIPRTPRRCRRTFLSPYLEHGSYVFE